MRENKYLLPINRRARDEAPRERERKREMKEIDRAVNYLASRN